MILRAALQKQEDKERVRLALLHAALRLAASHGFSSLGLREVAREAGIAPTSFYRHFADMQELGMSLIRELVGGVRREIAARVLAAPRNDVVSVLIDAMFAAAVREPELVRFVVAERVGAVAGFRALLRVEQAALAEALHTAWSAGTATQPTAADAAIRLLFDGCAEFLDGAVAGRDALREPLRWSIQTLLTAPRGDHA